MNVGYKLRVKGEVFYLLQFYPGCRNCSAPPGIIIRSIGPHSDDYDYLRHMPELPGMKIDGTTEWTIKTGMDPDEFAKAVRAQAVAGGFGKRTTLADGADDLAELVWDVAINVPPEAVEQSPRPPARAGREDRRA